MYHITVYDQDASTLHDEPLEAKTDDEAIQKGLKWLHEQNYLEKAYRIFHSSGYLVRFNAHKYKKAFVLQQKQANEE
ncbi:YhzD family protein [Mechercharimyces sp. CAU 1602]|uniref:YhzD family protein n=1 Tax=Mechercharimyces sp. CAU 1602 TaxID=2973933 RepID=UPI002163FCBE|nr:YhzD family protein [Mechercharimyces sp. CAU 1602]MCS1351741.1 hypothetical protein [Mechercharimyces sp. CAU 1602]